MCDLQINITGYWDLYNRVLSDKTTLLKAGAMPSSGLLGELLHNQSSNSHQTSSTSMKFQGLSFLAELCRII